MLLWISLLWIIWFINSHCSFDFILCLHAMTDCSEFWNCDWHCILFDGNINLMISLFTLISEMFKFYILFSDLHLPNWVLSMVTTFIFVHILLMCHMIRITLRLFENLNKLEFRYHSHPHWHQQLLFLTFRSTSKMSIFLNWVHFLLLIQEDHQRKVFFAGIWFKGIIFYFKIFTISQNIIFCFVKSPATFCLISFIGLHRQNISFHFISFILFHFIVFNIHPTYHLDLFCFVSLICFIGLNFRSQFWWWLHMFCQTPVTLWLFLSLFEQVEHLPLFVFMITDIISQVYYSSRNLTRTFHDFDLQVDSRMIVWFRNKKFDLFFEKAKSLSLNWVFLYFSFIILFIPIFNPLFSISRLSSWLRSSFF
jgi:hypothetical protein